MWLFVLTFCYKNSNYQQTKLSICVIIVKINAIENIICKKETDQRSFVVVKMDGTID